MKYSFFYFIQLLTIVSLLLSSCDDFFEDDISDKTIQVICPSDKTEISSNKISFVWSEEDGVEKYHVVIVSPSFDKAQQLVCDTILTSYKMELQLPKGDYQWSIQAENSGYKSLINYLTFKIKVDEE
ncbi:hypothetical protein [Bacteroides ovatus]|nr:hypothetical protein [Bacteroides ovatus]MCM1722609.1 hypothetical protein [Bacteroides ovatus]MCM1758986.1 hypothetical protein [Bacteroides ovatus]MCM1869047.1 hypothetical protein [Bacteroides ovatus]